MTEAIRTSSIDTKPSTFKVVRGKLVALGFSSLMAAGCVGADESADTLTTLPTNRPFVTETLQPKDTPYITISPNLTPIISFTSEITPALEVKHEPKVLWEVNTGSGSEPTIAVSPFDSKLVAVTYQHVLHKSGCDLTGVRISKDGGNTWHNTEQTPWKGSCPDFHGQVAWGPGTAQGSSRLWWADAMIIGKGKIATGVTYSDNLGETWTPLYIEKRTKPWIGGFPDITVDNNKNSPNFGTVYAAYNWLESSNGPGVSVIASGDNGKSWQMTQVPAVGLKDYPDYWRIGYRVKAAPDGFAFVSFYESDLQHWSKNDIFNQGGALNIGRLGFATARLDFDRSSKKLTAEPAKWAISLSRNNKHSVYNPQWQSELEVDSLGRLWMAVSDYAKKGIVHLGYSDDSGSSWKWRNLEVEEQSSYKPSLAVKDDKIFVGFHTLDSRGKVGTYYTFSYDGGESFLEPMPITPARWSLSSVKVSNGVGLRETADFGPDGIVRYAYGDGRKGNGQVDVFVSAIKP